jgi:hypothetical protein
MCSSYYKILWHRQSKHTDIQIHPYDSTWYTFNKKSLAHLSLYRSPESISLTWVYIAHLSLYRSSESISLTWVYIAHLSLYRSSEYIAHLSLYRSPESISLIWVYRSPESISLIWVYIAHLSLYRSSESISLTWVYIAHLSLYRSPEPVSLTWLSKHRSVPVQESLNIWVFFCISVQKSVIHILIWCCVKQCHVVVVIFDFRSTQNNCSFTVCILRFHFWEIQM